MTSQQRFVRYLDALLVAIVFVLGLHVFVILFAGGYAFTTRGITIRGQDVALPTIILLALLVLRLPLRHRAVSWDVFRSHEAVCIFSLLLMVYLANGRTIWSGDTLPARYLPLSIIRQGNFDLDEFPFLYARGMPYYLRSVKGHYVSIYPVGAALLSLPFYLPSALGPLRPESPVLADLEKLSAAAIVALSAVVLYFTLRRLTSLPMALSLTAIYALGTSSLSASSQALWQHGPSQLALTLALYCLVRGRREPRWSGFAGFPLGLAVISRPTDILIALPVGLYVLSHHRHQLARFLLAGLPPALFHLWYNATYFDNPVRTLSPLLRNDLFRSTPSLDGLMGILLSPGRGLFVYSPIFLFSLIGMGLAWRKDGDPLLRHLSVGVSLTILLYSMYLRWDGGSTYGPRLLADLAPVLVLCLYPLQGLLTRRRAARAAFLVAIAWSIGAHAIGAWWYDDSWNSNVWYAVRDVGRFQQGLWSWTDNQLVDFPRTVLDRAVIAAGGLPTSRRDRTLLSASYRADLPPMFTADPSQPIVLSVEATNDGRAVWLARARGAKGSVRLGWRWLREGKEMAEWSRRAPILHDVFPGQRYRFGLAVDPPGEPGTYTLELSLVSEHVVWFYDVGTPPLRIAVQLRGDSP